MIKLIALAALALGTSACTDAGWEKATRFGESGRITCHSGGRVILDDFSTGAIKDSEQSDGYYFKSGTTGTLMEASGECIISYSAARPAGWTHVHP